MNGIGFKCADAQNRWLHHNHSILLRTFVYDLQSTLGSIGSVIVTPGSRQFGSIMLCNSGLFVRYLCVGTVTITCGLRGHASWDYRRMSGLAILAKVIWPFWHERFFSPNEESRPSVDFGPKIRKLPNHCGANEKGFGRVRRSPGEPGSILGRSWVDPESTHSSHSNCSRAFGCTIAWCGFLCGITLMLSPILLGRARLTTVLANRGTHRRNRWRYDALLYSIVGVAHAAAQPAFSDVHGHLPRDPCNAGQSQLLIALAVAAAGGWAAAAFWWGHYCTSVAFRRGLEAGLEHRCKQDWWFDYGAGVWAWGSAGATSASSSLNPWAVPFVPAECDGNLQHLQQQPHQQRQNLEQRSDAFTQRSGDDSLGDATGGWVCYIGLAIIVAAFWSAVGLSKTCLYIMSASKRRRCRVRAMCIPTPCNTPIERRTSAGASRCDVHAGHGAGAPVQPQHVQQQGLSDDAYAKMCLNAEAAATSQLPANHREGFLRAARAVHTVARRHFKSVSSMKQVREVTSRMLAYTDWPATEQDIPKAKHLTEILLLMVGEQVWRFNTGATGQPELTKEDTGDATAHPAARSDINADPDIEHVDIPVSSYEKVCVQAAWLICDKYHPAVHVKVRPAAKRVLANAYGAMNALTGINGCPGAVTSTIGGFDLIGLSTPEQNCLKDIIASVAADVVYWKLHHKAKSSVGASIDWDQRSFSTTASEFF